MHENVKLKKVTLLMLLRTLDSSLFFCLLLFFFLIKNTYVVSDANFIFLVATALCSVTCKKGRPLDLESFISLHVLGV